MTDWILTDRLKDAANAGDYELMAEAAKEIIRLSDLVDALTVKLNKVLNQQYVGEELLKERIDALEHHMAALRGRMDRLRELRGCKGRVE